jgi:transcriptional regulator GlxA family with amidase domain
MPPHPGTVAVAVTDGVPIFEVAVPCLVFGQPRLDLADPWYEFRLCAAKPRRTRADAWFLADTPYTLEALQGADTVIVPACEDVHEHPPVELVEAVRAAHQRGARIVSICSGAVVLAAGGLLDGRAVATHWMHTALLAERYPAVRVNADVLYVDDGDVLTSAGTAAGIDLCLHVLRCDLGAVVANAVARRLVVPAHRPGGQAQYVERPLPADDANGLAPLLQWATRRLDRPLTIADLAHQAHVSPRTLVRRFHAATGTTPLRWLVAQRIERARELLESTDLPIEHVAERCGFGSAPTLRHHFSASVGVSPNEYRRTFHTTAQSPATAGGRQQAVGLSRGLR